MTKNILIVCEDESISPKYFLSIRDILIDKGLDITIRVFPIPKSESELIYKKREGAKRRELKKINNLIEEKLKKYQVEEDYKAQPTRYVREAQMGLEDGTYDEVWAVYDKDGHPNQEEAFNLSKTSINNKNVNLAFSSIAFEQWILIHFEENNTPFQKSQCRIGEETFCCGTDINPNDCKGEKCVHGYMITKQLIDKDCKKKTYLYGDLPAPFEAIQNAVIIRSSSNPSLPFYELNPYSTTDRLVFRLINLPTDYCWVDGKETVNTKYFSFIIVRVGVIIEITIKIRDETFILESGLFGLINAQGIFKPVTERILINQKEITVEINLEVIQDFTPVYLGLKMGDNQYLFTDL